MGCVRNAWRTLVGRRQLGRPRKRWDDNINTCVGEIDRADRTELTQDRVECYTLISAALNIGVLLPECLFHSFHAEVI